MNIGVIVAGGTGERFGGHKQITVLNNKPIYQYSLDVFNDSDLIDSIYLVFPKDLLVEIKNDLSTYNSSKPVILCQGGETRSESVYNAIKQLDSNTKIVIIHDAVRPLIKNEHIKDLTIACQKNDGAILAHPVSDTLKKSNDNIVDFTIDRNNLWLAETPQAFNLNLLSSCYDNIETNDRKAFTDEASLMEHFGHKIQVVHNRSENIKITKKEDLELIKGRLYNQNKMGIGVDFHSLVQGKYLIVGGHKINCEFASDAHSDGDVLTHAVTDALLGALNLGDIGEHFPNTSEYLNISSIELLQKIIKKIPKDTKIAMVDISIVLNAPKISPHKKAIKTSLSEALGVNEDIISIKATTTNGLRFLDMSNGWGCEAIVTLSHAN